MYNTLLQNIFFRATHTAKQIICEPCPTEYVLVPATNFCKTCDNSKELCETCSKQHTKQEQNRNDEICMDISEYQINEENARYLFFCQHPFFQKYLQNTTVLKVHIHHCEANRIIVGQ